MMKIRMNLHVCCDDTNSKENTNTVKVGYNDNGYNEFTVTMNEFSSIVLVQSSLFITSTFTVITNNHHGPVEFVITESDCTKMNKNSER